jgi:hypothetical protein
MQRSSFDFDLITGPAARHPATPQLISRTHFPTRPVPAPQTDAATTEARQRLQDAAFGGANIDAGAGAVRSN